MCLYCKIITTLVCHINEVTSFSESVYSLKVKTPTVSEDLTVLAPGHMAPILPTAQGDGMSKKKRRKSLEMTMEERLNAISIDQPTPKTAATEPPKADTLVTLLSQGLQSGDKKILNVCFNNSKVLHRHPLIFIYYKSLVLQSH